jgi:hypothetical protein
VVGTLPEKRYPYSAIGQQALFPCLDEALTANACTSITKFARIYRAPKPPKPPKPLFGGFGGSGGVLRASRNSTACLDCRGCTTASFVETPAPSCVSIVDLSQHTPEPFQGPGQNWPYACERSMNFFTWISRKFHRNMILAPFRRKSSISQKNPHPDVLDQGTLSLSGTTCAKLRMSLRSPN